MNVLLAVMKELWTFATAALFRPNVSVPEKSLELPLPHRVVHIAPTRLLPLLPTLVPEVAAAPKQAAQIEQQNGVFYVAVPLVRVRREPVVAFDNVECSLTYGTAVQAGRRSGRFVYVTFGERAGWIEGDVLNSVSHVFPQLQRGKSYDAYNPETEKLRACLSDSFNGSESASMLSGVEYVTYRLWQKGLSLPWPATYGRVPGTWQRKLRGVRGIRIDIMPHTGSVMEYILDDVGYVGYVESVTPQLKIKVTGVGLTNEGQLTEQVLEHAVWRELHPVFIILG